MKQTAITKLMEKFRELDKSHNHLPSHRVLEMLERSHDEERAQIENAFLEGCKAGSDMIHICDYPGSNYYHAVYVKGLEANSSPIESE